MKKLFILFIAVAGFSISSFAQDTQTATATAKIITPITLTNTQNMDFGNIAAGLTAGSVVLLPAGTVSATGGTQIPAVGKGTPKAATFSAAGAANYTYAITLPSTHDVRIGGVGGATMTLGTFTSTPSGTGLLDGTGAQTITIGATLTVGASQIAGTYNSVGTFPVTVNYN